MPDSDDLFTFAGIIVDEHRAKPPKPRKPKPLSLAERAAAGRLGGARRSRPALRGRVGAPRQLEPG